MGSEGPRRVLHVDTGRSWRGGQAQVHNLLRHMNEKSVENHLLVPPESPLIQRFDGSQKPRSISTHPLRGEWDLSAAWTIRRTVRDRSIDLIHAHSSRALGICWLGSCFFGLPPFLETRRLETPVAQNYFSRRKYAAASHHIANSETVKETLIECGIEEKTISVVPSGIDLDKIDAADPNPSLLRDLGIDPDRPVIGNVGALCPQKDQETFLRAAADVHQSFPEAQFVIAGEGELRPDLEELIESLEAAPYCKLAGFVDDIFGFMKSLDLFVLTSRYEGLCGTLMQAMACRVPVVTSDVKGSRQIIHDGENCVAVEPGDRPGFVRALKKFLEQPETHESLLGEARSTAERFDYNRLARQTRERYESILAEATSADGD